MKRSMTYQPDVLIKVLNKVFCKAKDPAIINDELWNMCYDMVLVDLALDTMAFKHKYGIPEQSSI